ncbi:hypothetical protein M3Y96_00542800 [Aphelenchoides besseyi]|nr:hypothetical protein M3Y96_00542800 [Aphelenchoides besseyi]
MTIVLEVEWNGATEQSNIRKVLDWNESEELRLLLIEKQRGNRRLSDMETILKFNSDVLPTISAFGTKNWTTICRRERNCLPKLQNMYTQTRYAKKYKTVACLIQKSLSTVLQAIMCFLHNETAFRSASRVLSRESYRFRFCIRKNEMNTNFSNTLHNNKMNIDSSWLHLAVVREPIDRFLSGFVDKCVRKPDGKKYCNGCHSNITCFLITEHDRIQRQIKSRKFIRSFEDRHFFPQNWRCDFHWHFKQYRFIRYKSGVNGTNEFLAQLLPLLKQQGVGDESLEFIRDQLKSGRTIHSTVSSRARKFFEKRIRSSPFLMEYVVRLFYHDFKLFDFPIPEFQFDK